MLNAERVLGIFRAQGLGGFTHWECTMAGLGEIRLCFDVGTELDLREHLSLLTILRDAGARHVIVRASDGLEVLVGY